MWASFKRVSTLDKTGRWFTSTAPGAIYWWASNTVVTTGAAVTLLIAQAWGFAALFSAFAAISGWKTRQVYYAKADREAAAQWMESRTRGE